MACGTASIPAASACRWPGRWANAFALMQKPFGISITKNRVHSNGQTADYFVDAAEWRAFQAGMDRLLCLWQC